ncbi:MAG: hypothetical protein ABSD64_06930 [Terriglobales bacterium]
MSPSKQVDRCIFVALALLDLIGCTLLFAQTNAGSAIGTSAFNAASAVLLQTMKEPKPTVGVGPRRLDFNGVGLNEPALNVVTITNGTTSPIEIESLLTPSSGFRLSSSVTLPLTIPPQTKALLTVEFLPTRFGNYNGAFNVLYRTTKDSHLHKMGIELKGKGTQK